MSTVLEKDFQRAVQDALSIFGWRWAHYRAARTEQGWRTPLSGDPGLPDLISVRGERLLYAELKSARGRLGPGQGEWLAALAGAGVETYLWRPQDWARIDEVLR